MTLRPPRSLARCLRTLVPLACLAFAACGSPVAAPASRPPMADDDPRVRWLAEHAIRLRSVSPADQDFSDLEPLRQVLTGVRVVLLGEQSHGDGTVFLAKTRLIEFLHQRMGFEVLAFESGLYDCARAWQRLAAGEDAATAVPRGVFGIWTRSEQVRPLIAYLGAQARSARPLELAGFDDQLTGSASREELVGDLAAFLRRIGAPSLAGPEWPAFAALLQNLAENAYQRGKLPRPAAEEQQRFLRQLDRLRAEVAARGGAADRDADFWAQVLASLAPAARQQWLYDPAAGEVPPEILGLRDRQMGENLLWLANRRYPGRKIVVWAATFHAARHLGRIETEAPELRRLYRGLEVMGEVAWRELGEEMYTVGFTASEGRTGTPFEEAPTELAPPSAGSLEDLFHRAGLELAIVDFRRPPAGGGWLRQPLLSRPLGYLEMRADWGEVVDGMLYTRTMAPSTRAPEPEAAKAPDG